MHVTACNFLACGLKICPESNFLLVSMVALPDVHANVLGAIFFAFSNFLAQVAEVAVLRVVMSLACRSAKFLAEGSKIDSEPNFVLLLMIALDEINSSYYLFLIFLTFLLHIIHYL